MFDKREMTGSWLLSKPSQHFPEGTEENFGNPKSELPVSGS
jgi:hypothetical protein